MQKQKSKPWEITDRINVSGSEEILTMNLNAIVNGIEALLKPYRNTLTVEIEKASGVIQAIRIQATINTR